LLNNPKLNPINVIGKIKNFIVPILPILSGKNITKTPTALPKKKKDPMLAIFSLLQHYMFICSKNP